VYEDVKAGIWSAGFATFPTKRQMFKFGGQGDARRLSLAPESLQLG